MLTESKALVRIGSKVERIIAQVDSALKSINCSGKVNSVHQMYYMDHMISSPSEVNVTTEELAARLKAPKLVDDHQIEGDLWSIEDHDGTLDELTKVNEVKLNTVGPPLSKHLCASSIIKVFR